MIDTVILLLRRDQITVLEQSGRLGTDWELIGRTAMYDKWVRNPKLIHKKTGHYYPRLTGYRRNGVSDQVRIEFSVPKLIFGDNLNEVDRKDFSRVVNTLVDRLFELGVVVKPDVLKNADVLGFHPSKNIALSDGYTAGFVLRELSKINLGKRFDLNKADFRNSGQSLQGYTAGHAIVFYDKIADLAKPMKRAIDKDRIAGQLSLFQEIKKEAPRLEVLRLEIRLSQKQKMKSVLKKLGGSDQPKFKDIFSKSLCKKIVADYWQTMVADRNLFLFSLASGPKQLLGELLASGTKSKEAVYLVGLSMLTREEGGIRELRSTIEGKYGTRGWYRIAGGFKRLSAGVEQKQCHSWVSQITASIEKFDSFHFARHE